MIARLTVGLVSGLMAWSAAFADPPIGSRLGSRVEGNAMKDEAKAARKAHAYASCVAHLRAPSAKAFLAATSVEEGQRRRSAMSREIECNDLGDTNNFVEGQMLYFSTDLLRGMIAEVYVADQRVAMAALPALPRVNLYNRPWFAGTGRDRVVDEMAACVADTQPGGTLRLVTSAAYTSAEDSTFQALVPAMGPCLTVGARLRAGRQALRAALADALYQRFVAPVAVMPTSLTAGSH